MDPTPIPYDRGRGGQAIGEGISAFGNALSRLGREQTAEAEAQEQFDVKMKADEYTYQRSLEIDDRIANYNETQHGPPGEFDARYAAEREAKDKEFVAGIKGSPKAQRLAMAMVQNSRQSAIMRAQNARQGFVQQSNIARVMAMVDNAGDAMDGNPETVATAHAKIAQDVAIVPGLTPAQRNRAMDVASKKLWDKWLLKADEAQLERGLADYHKGRAEWSKRFEKDEAGAADDLGRVSAKYESGGRGVAFVSSGAGDPGGPSYGIHQLSAKDSMPAFLRSPEGAKYAERLTGSPWSPEFRAEYQRIAAEDGAGLAKAQKDFYTRTHYKPALEAAKKAGFDTEDRGVQEALFSIGVQHGGAARIISAASPEGDARAQIRSLYQARTQYVAGLGSLPDGTKQSVLNRYVNEERDAAALSGRRVSVGGGGSSAPLSTSPEAEAPDGTMPAPIKKFALPDRATPYDHMVNNFGDIAPKVQERLEKYREHREAQATFVGIRNGTIPFNANDSAGRAFVDKGYAALGIGQMIAAGTPAKPDLSDPTSRALAIAAMDADRMNYVPKSVYEGLQGLMDSTDPDKKLRGYTAMLNFYDKNPNIFDVHGGDKAALVEAEKFRRYSRTMEPQDAIKRLIEEKKPGYKIAAMPKEERVKLMKLYEGDKAIDAVVKDLDEGWGKGAGNSPWGGFLKPTGSADHKQRNAMVSDYRDALEYGLDKEGTIDGAKAYAATAMKRRYGTSYLFGREAVMPYPPEKHFAPDKTGSWAYIEKEAREFAGIYNTNANPTTMRLRVVEDVRYWRGGKPVYEIVINRKDNGFQEIVPGHFQPGAPQGSSSEDARIKFEADRAKAQAPGSPERQSRSDKEIGEKIGRGFQDAVEAPVKAARDAVVDRLATEKSKAADEKARGVDAGLEITRNPGQRKTNPIDALTPAPRRRAPSVGGE